MADSEKESELDAAEAIYNADTKNKKVQYLHVKTPITKTENGSLVGSVEISEFDI